VGKNNCILRSFLFVRSLLLSQHTNLQTGGGKKGNPPLSYWIDRLEIANSGAYDNPDDSTSGREEIVYRM
jgi:hypothetical protein